MEFVLGLLLGLLTPIFGIAILMEYYPKVHIDDPMNQTDQVFLYSRIIMFAVVVNAGIFFAALRFNRDGLSKGILIACLL